MTLTIVPQPSSIDIELGQPGQPDLVGQHGRHGHPPHDSSVRTTSCVHRLRVVLSAWKWFSGHNVGGKGCEAPARQVEDYGNGYPRFSALIASHPSLYICRRFSNLRARLLLLQQDKLSMLEERLEKIDLDETSVVFLGNSRRDTNQARKDVLLEIDTALAKYDSLIERNHRMLTFEAAKPRDVLNLQNWVDGNGCIARKEIAYLKRSNDLLSVASSDDSAVTQLEAWVEDSLIRFYRGFHETYRHGVSRDPNVFIPSGPLITQVARTLIVSLIVIILLVPVVICNTLGSVTPRMIVIVLATISFVATMSGLTKAKTVEMFVAGAAYATVLTVFVSGTDSSTS